MVNKHTLKNKIITVKNIIKISTLAFSAVLFVSCYTSPEKVNQDNNDVKKANQDLDNINKEYEADVAKYKVETDNEISENQKRMLDFKARIANEKAATKEAYQRRLADLEQKESDLKKKLDDYKLDGKENWIIFKTEFNRDMAQLGKALKDLTVKNTGE